jgi:hypothetical protein
MNDQMEELNDNTMRYSTTSPNKMTWYVHEPLSSIKKYIRFSEKSTYTSNELPYYLPLASIKHSKRQITIIYNEK